MTARLKLPVADGIEPVPDERRVLGFLDQGTLWANLGVSLVGIVTGAALVPTLSFGTAMLVLVLGGLIGACLLAASAWLGATTALPAMAIMRRALGVRGARLPTVLNILQNTGWSAVETWTVAEAAHALPVIGGGPRIVYYLVAGALGIVLAVTGPLGVVRRLLRRYVTPLLAIALAYLLIALLRDADLGIAATGGLPFMVALDIVIAYNASWLPLAPDYTRFSGRPARAALGAATGYFLGTSLVFIIGFLVGTLGGVSRHERRRDGRRRPGVRVAGDRRHRRRREREDVRQRLLDRRLGPEPRTARVAAPRDRRDRRDRDGDRLPAVDQPLLRLPAAARLHLRAAVRRRDRRPPAPAEPGRDRRGVGGGVRHVPVAVADEHRLALLGGAVDRRRVPVRRAAAAGRRLVGRVVAGVRRRVRAAARPLCPRREPEPVVRTAA